MIRQALDMLEARADCALLVGWSDFELLIPQPLPESSSGSGLSFKSRKLRVPSICSLAAATAASGDVKDLTVFLRKMGRSHNSGFAPYDHARHSDQI